MSVNLPSRPPAVSTLKATGPLKPALLPLALVPPVQDLFTSAPEGDSPFNHGLYENYQPPLPGQSSLRIVYNNDPHEKFKALPYLVSAFRFFSTQGRQRGQDVLRLNGGDNNIGKEPEDWQLNTSLLNLIGYDAVAMGNHEMDTGAHAYGKALVNANFPTLISNVSLQPTSMMAEQVRQGKIWNQPRIIRQGNSVYGLIGLTTPELRKVVSGKSDLEGMRALDFEDTLEITRNQVNWLQSQGVNKIIVVSHMGADRDQELAGKVAGIDVIVGGHSHDVFDDVEPGENWLQSLTGEPVLVLQAGKNARWVGVADMNFTPDGKLTAPQNRLWNPFLFTPDPQAKQLRNSVLGVPRTIARIETPTDADGNEFHADKVAAFTGDAMRSTLGTDIALVRSAEIRGNIMAGEFTDQELKALMPFTDPVVQVWLTGQELLDAFSRSARGVAEHETHPGMLHPSGMAVVLDGDAGQVVSAQVWDKPLNIWQPLDRNRLYTVALGDFTVSGSREFPELAKPERIFANSGQPARNFFLSGLRQAGAPFRPIYFHDDNRLRIA